VKIAPEPWSYEQNKFIVVLLYVWNTECELFFPIVLYTINVEAEFAKMLGNLNFVPEDHREVYEVTTIHNSYINSSYLTLRLTYKLIFCLSQVKNEVERH